MSKNSFNIGQMQAYYDKRSRSVKLTVKEPGSPLKEQGFLITLPEGSTGYRMILDELLASNAAHDVAQVSDSQKQPTHIRLSEKYFSPIALHIPLGHTTGIHETQYCRLDAAPHILLSSPSLHQTKDTMHVMLHHVAQHQGDLTAYYYQGNQADTTLYEKLETLDTPFENISLHDDTTKFHVVKTLHTTLMHRYAYLEKHNTPHIEKTSRHFPRLLLMIEDYEQWIGDMDDIQQLLASPSLDERVDSVLGLREYDEHSLIYKTITQNTLHVLLRMIEKLQNQRAALHREDEQQQFLPMIPWEKSSVHVLKSIVEDADTWKACVDACRGTELEADVVNLYHKTITKTLEAHTFREIAGLLHQYIQDKIDRQMKENQEYITMLHQILRLGRSAGIHVILAEEDGNRNNILGEPRSNIGTRVTYQQNTLRIQEYNELPVDCTPFRWSI